MLRKKNITRSGFVALIGAPNAGKSTFVNYLSGIKVSIVTHKVQTTRTLVYAIITRDTTQIALIDTPGIFNPSSKKRLERAMVSTAWRGARDADSILFIMDARTGLTEEIKNILKILSKFSQKKILLLNKIDTIPHCKLLPLIAEIQQKVIFERCFMISALTGAGCNDVLAYLTANMPVGPWYYPENQVSNMPIRQIMAEITREKLYLRLHDELPYALTVETECWQEQKNGALRIDQVIYVERESQRKIILGHKGATIKSISFTARKEMATILKKSTHLFLFIKVRADWHSDPARYQEMGLDFIE